MKLLPCPFCGSKAKVYTRNDIEYGTEFYIECTNCDCVYENGYSEKDIINKWNTRVSSSRIKLNKSKNIRPVESKKITFNIKTKRILLSCPFCNTIPKIRSVYDIIDWDDNDEPIEKLRYVVECVNEDCKAKPITDPFDTEEEAICIWNYRKE